MCAFDVPWRPVRCVLKRDVIFVAEYGDHDDSVKVSNVAAVALRVSCKRIELRQTYPSARPRSFGLHYTVRCCYMSWRPSRDVVNCPSAVYRERCKQCGTLLCAFILCMNATDHVALLELQVAVLLTLHLCFCWKYICAFVAVFCAFIAWPSVHSMDRR